MQKSTFKKYKDAIKRRSKTWSKSEIQSFKNMLNRKRWAKDETKQKISELDEMFYEMMQKKGSLNITKEHSEQGLNYLKNLAFKKDGSCRNLKDFPFNQKQVEILRNFKKFTFEGYLWASEIFRENQYHDEAMIVFRVHAKNGEYFDYIPVHWGMPIVVKFDSYGYPYKQSAVKPKKLTDENDFFNAPRIDSDEIGPQFKELETLFCDSSGFGRDDERALSVTQATAKIKKLIDENSEVYAAITDAGQFQVYVSIFERC